MEKGEEAASYRRSLFSPSIQRARFIESRYVPENMCAGHGGGELTHIVTSPSRR